jgi:hypothetical protein
MGLKDADEIKRKDYTRRITTTETTSRFPSLIAIILILAIVVGAIFHILFFQKGERGEEGGAINYEGSKLTDAQVLKIASQEPIIKDFVSRNPKYLTKVSFLSVKNVTSLSEKSPAIYSDLPKKGLYKVEYYSNSDGILLIIDPDDKQVLKYYRVKTMWFP